MASILVAEDDQELANQTFLDLKEDGHTVQVAHNLNDAIELMRKHRPAIVLCDLYLGDDSGLDLLRRSRTVKPLPDVLMVTGKPSGESAEAALSLGAYEYLQKPFSADELRALTRRILERRAMLQTSVVKPISAGTLVALVASSPEMMAVLESLDQVAKRKTTVLLSGETGTGKDVLSRHLHRTSTRADGPYVAVNCAALPENLLASELFGHEKGAFTGATSQRLGAFEQADGGTLFLDEIGDVSLATQAHLLRVLESGRLKRVGGEKMVQVDVRVVAATHRDLQRLVDEGQFRADLFYRIHVYPIPVPALRERRREFPDLVRHFLEVLNADSVTIDEAGLNELRNYDWPGNIRELRNVIENLAIRHSSGVIPPHEIRAFLDPFRRRGNLSAGEETLAEAEIRTIREALADAGGNKSDAAKRLGISRRKLYSRMNVLGIDDDPS